MARRESKSGAPTLFGLLARRLHERGIPFVPDFVASAGGVIGGALEIGSIDQAGYEQRLEGIYTRTLEILNQARHWGVSPNEIAESLADGVGVDSGDRQAKTQPRCGHKLGAHAWSCAAGKR